MQYYTDSSSSYSSSFSSSSSSVGSFLRQLSNSSKLDPCSGSYSANSKRWSSNYSMRKQQQQSTDDHHQLPPNMDSSYQYSSNLYVEGLNKLYYHHHHDHDQDHYNVVKKKRVMVVVDSSNRSKQAMMWALTHVSNKGDLLTLLHIIPNQASSSVVNGGGDGGGSSSSLAASLASLCKACKPEVEIEGLVIEGPKLVETVLSQVKKLDVSVLVLGQKKPSPLSCLFQCGSRNHGLGDEFVEECINSAECLALAVRKQSKSVGGYLISTRWQKNFWLLA